MSKRASLLLGLCLFLLTGTLGSAHQSSLPHRDASHSLEQRLVRHPVHAQSANDGTAQRVARARFERWFASQTGERRQPIDGMPDSGGQGEEDDDHRFVDPDQEGPVGTQSELSIAVDATGQHIVVGLNDFRGFSVGPVLSISGFMYSDDGGATFTDGK